MLLLMNPMISVMKKHNNMNSYQKFVKEKMLF